MPPGPKKKINCLLQNIKSRDLLSDHKLPCCFGVVLLAFFQVVSILEQFTFYWVSVFWAVKDIRFDKAVIKSDLCSAAVWAGVLQMLCMPCQGLHCCHFVLNCSRWQGCEGRQGLDIAQRTTFNWWVHNTLVLEVLMFRAVCLFPGKGFIFLLQTADKLFSLTEKCISNSYFKFNEFLKLNLRLWEADKMMLLSMHKYALTWVTHAFVYANRSCSDPIQIP